LRNVSVTLPESLLEAIQSHPVLKTVNRSKLVREAVADYLERHVIRKEIEKVDREKEKEI